VTIERSLILFQLAMALAAAAFFVSAIAKFEKAAGSAKNLLNPSLIFGFASLGCMFVARLAQFIVRPPTISLSIAVAAMSFVVIVLFFLVIALHYRKLYRVANGQTL
jgi:hypothetical protein